MVFSRALLRYRFLGCLTTNYCTMGTAASTSEEYLRDEFKRLNNLENREYLVLEQLFSFRQKYIEHPVDPNHLGVLFVLDKNKNGKFDFDEFFEFVKLLEQQALINDSADFPSQFQAYCTLKMWNEVSQPGGMDLFVEWLCNLFVSNMPIQYSDNHPGIEFLNRDTIKTFHKVLNIYETYGYDFQSFFDLLQRVAEDQTEKAFMYLKEEELDDVVPLVVLKQFAHSFIKGFIHLMGDLGFEPGIKIE